MKTGFPETKPTLPKILAQRISAFHLLAPSTETDLTQIPIQENLAKSI
jgi:hypothetical protein